MEEDEVLSNIDSIADEEYMEPISEPFGEESHSASGDISVPISVSESESELFASHFKAKIISLVEKAKDDDTKEKIRNKIALYKERIQSRRLSQIFDEVVDSLPSDSAVEISKEDLDDFDELIKRNVENVCSQNRADELKSEGSLSDCGNTSSDASIDGLGKGDVRKSTTWVLCPNWNKMCREEKKDFVEAEELKRKEVLREEMARKRELEKVKNIIGSELNDQDLVITESILGILDNIGKNDEGKSFTSILSSGNKP
ncbi:hypothetical protein L6452_33321 [Arctium lappa]|uniref:Uncharacterized protein n=1 Tax=Arctium lappa TaxID=4217 RepID=A0ACB8YFQ9_ARCLA|nr:hypothetical protein L6452_33321 [Arctium lappa]